MKIYYGPETKKAITNFPFSSNLWQKEFVVAVLILKRAAAVANFKAGNINQEISKAIVKAVDEVLEGKLWEQFPLPALMGGAGTSIHMNVNEVLASKASEYISSNGKSEIVNPNDHVNRSQSTNDVNPSAVKVASVKLLKVLIIELEGLKNTFENRAKEFKKVPKLGRTHLQDAVPIMLGEELNAYANILEGHIKNIKQVLELSYVLNLGGTAVGNSVNASPKYISEVYLELNKITKEKFVKNKNLMSGTNSGGNFVRISQAVTALCMDLSKIATDFRYLSSLPNGGVGEIILEELQKGSSIMPGKINPVMPETVNNLYFWVSGNNLSIELAAHSANLELSVMLPTIADRLIESISLTGQVVKAFNSKCIKTFSVNIKRCKELLEKSTAYATVLTPILGYEKMSEVVKESVKTGRNIREIILSYKYLTETELENIIRNK